MFLSGGFISSFVAGVVVGGGRAGVIYKQERDRVKQDSSVTEKTSEASLFKSVTLLDLTYNYFVNWISS